MNKTMLPWISIQARLVTDQISSGDKYEDSSKAIESWTSAQGAGDVGYESLAANIRPSANQRMFISTSNTTSNREHGFTEMSLSKYQEFIHVRQEAELALDSVGLDAVTPTERYRFGQSMVTG